MKNIKYILFAFLIITGCSDDDDQTLTSVSAKYQNLHVNNSKKIKNGNKVIIFVFNIFQN